MYFQSVLQYLRLSAMSATTTFIPWMLPLTYSAMLGLQMNNVDPSMILVLTVVGSVTGTMILRGLDIFCAPWVARHIKIPEKRKQEYKHNQKKATRLSKKTSQLHKKLHIVNKPSILFWLVAITTLTPIPDILIVRYTRGKLTFLFFALATLLGKIVNYAPVIYGIELTKLISW